MPSRPPHVRLLLVSVLLPSVIVAADSAVLSVAGSANWSSATALGTFALFLAQGSAVSYAAGRWLPDWRWRFVLLGWLAILVDLLLYTASVVSGGGGYSYWSELLIYGFYGSQLSSGLIWGILGSLAWRRRLCGAAFVAAPATYFLLRITAEQSYVVAQWLAITLVQAVGVAGMCGLLRAIGYRMDHVDNNAAYPHGSALQFSIGHMLVWTLAAALIVSVAKQVAIYSSGGYGLREWLLLAIAGTTLAIVALAAMWMVLGAGRGVLKLVIALSIATSAGAFLWYADRHFVSRAGVFWLPEVGPWWLGWSLLAEPFLAGLLLVFYTTGYRLVWHRRMSS
jgi:hypothetical protein